MEKGVCVYLTGFSRLKLFLPLDVSAEFQKTILPPHQSKYRVDDKFVKWNLREDKRDNSVNTQTTIYLETPATPRTFADIFTSSKKHFFSLCVWSWGCTCYQTDRITLPWPANCDVWPAKMWPSSSVSVKGHVISVSSLSFAIFVLLMVPSSGFVLTDDLFNSLFQPVVEPTFKAKVETLGAVLKRHVQQLRSTENRQVCLAFYSCSRK